LQLIENNLGIGVRKKDAIPKIRRNSSNPHVITLSFKLSDFFPVEKEVRVKFIQEITLVIVVHIV
jgi:hypothetical protein